MLKEQFYDTSEIQINYATGPANGLPLLLLHGVTSNWQSFLPVISGLYQHSQIVAMDLRGHGMSGKIKHGYTLTEYSVDVVHFVQAKLEGSAIILGHSFGALIAVYVAANLPQSIRGIILLDPPLIYRRMELKNSPWMGDQEAYHWFSTAYDILRSSQSVNEIDNSLHSLFPSWPAENRHALAHRLSQMDPDVLGMLISHQHMEGYDIEQLLEQLICPVLVFQGNRSRGAALADEDAQYLMRQLDSCTIIRLEEAGHNLHETHSKEIVEHVIHFITTV